MTLKDKPRVGHPSDFDDNLLRAQFYEKPIESRFCTVEEAEARCPEVLAETWLDNESDLSIPNFNCIVKYNRPNTRAGGVAVYQNSSDTVNIITPSMDCSVGQSDIYGTIQSSVGDLCLAECVIDNGQKIIIVAVYITPNKKLDDIIEFLHRSLLPYTSRGSALLNKNYDKIPMILSGDFNVNFALDKSLQLIEFLKDNFTFYLYKTKE
ncbi:ATP-dependent DNA helicase [Trichonephila clavipes]|nr:ATP-dependent DNA helicase [Trichonephila clavipes]